jgi:hypothetical protein
MTDKPRLKTAGAAVTVSTTAELRQALAAGYSPENIVVKPTPAPAPAAAPAPSVQQIAAALPQTEALKTAQEAAALAERHRISSIYSATREGFEGLRDQAIAEGWDAGTFAVRSLQEERDRGVTMAGIRADSPKAAPHGGKYDRDPAEGLIAAAREMGVAK